jgi:hypothetical protein
MESIMQISGLNFYARTNTPWWTQRATNEITKDPRSASEIEQDARVAKAAPMFEKATEILGHSTALRVENYRLFKGETILPENRLSLEGVTAEYLRNMSNDEYSQALEKEGQRYSIEGGKLMKEAFATASPDDPSIRTNENQRPEMSTGDAKSVLPNYVSTLVDTISLTSQLHKYLNSENAWDYLVERYGEEGATAERTRTREDIKVLDGVIKNALTSLNIIYSLNGSPATQQEKWAMGDQSHRWTICPG